MLHKEIVFIHFKQQFQSIQYEFVFLLSLHNHEKKFFTFYFFILNAYC